MQRRRHFKPKVWAKLVTDTNEGLTACGRVQFLFYMRRLLSKPYSPASSKLIQFWNNREGLPNKMKHQ